MTANPPIDARDDTELANEIEDYWDNRSTSYSKNVLGELSDERRSVWESALKSRIGEAFDGARGHTTRPRVLDLGCGPGFFCILFSERGWDVSAIDGSEEMLACARENVATAVPDNDVDFHYGDVAALPFPDSSFDVVASRNLTWLLRDPEGAYAEWLRVLKPGGKLIVFDANWYRYLVDADVAKARKADQENNTLEVRDEGAQATSDEEKQCEEIATHLPMTSILRPAWDIEVLKSLGASRVWADEDAWLSIWSENEKSYYRATPMFSIEAVK